MPHLTNTGKLMSGTGVIIGLAVGIGGYLWLSPILEKAKGEPVEPEPIAAAIIADLRENPETWRSDGMLNWTNGRWTVAQAIESAAWPGPLIVCAGDQTVGDLWTPGGERFERPAPAADVAAAPPVIVSSEMVAQYRRDSMTRACSNEPSARLSPASGNALREAFSDHNRVAAENMRLADMRAVEKATGV